MMSGTVLPVTPFTVVLSVLSVEVLLTVVDPVSELLSTKRTHALPDQ